MVAVVLLAGIFEPARQANPPRRHPLQEIKEGAAFVFRHPLLRPVFVTQFIFNVAWFVVLAVFVPYAIRHLGLSAAGVGTTLGDVWRRHGGGRAFRHAHCCRLPFGSVIGLGPVTGSLPRRSLR